MAVNEKLGEAYVEIPAKLDKLSAGLAKAEAMVRGTMSRIGAAVAGFGGAFGFGAAVKAADDLDRAMRYAGMIFGASSKTIIDQSEKMSSTMGILRAESIRGAAEIGQVFRSAGNTTTEAAQMAGALTRAAAAAGMIRDVDLPEALKAVEYGLEGSNRGLRRLGVNIHDAQAEYILMQRGITKTNDSLYESRLVEERAELIMRALSASVRNLDTTNLSLGTRMRIVWANFRHALEDLGKGIAPISNTLVNAFVRMAASISDFASRNLPTIQYFSEYVVWGFGQVGEAAAGLWSKISENFSGIGGNFDWLKGVAQDVFETIGVLWRNWSLIGERTGIMIMGGLTNIGETFSWLQSTISAFLEWFATNWRSIFTDAFNAVTTALINLGTNFRDFGKAAYDWIASGFSKPFELKLTPIMAGAAAAATPAFKAPALELSSVEEELAKVDEKMVKVEQKRLDELERPGPARPGPGGPRAAEFPPPLRRPVAAEFVSLTEFAKKIQIGALSSGADYAKQTAEWTKRTAEAVEKIADQGGNAQVAIAAGPA